MADNARSRDDQEKADDALPIADTGSSSDNTDDDEVDDGGEEPNYDHLPPKNRPRKKVYKSTLRKRNREKRRRDQFNVAMNQLTELVFQFEPSLATGRSDLTSSDPQASVTNRGEMMECAVDAMRRLVTENQKQRARIKQLECALAGRRLLGGIPGSVPGSPPVRGRDHAANLIEQPQVERQPAGVPGVAQRIAGLPAAAAAAPYMPAQLPVGGFGSMTNRASPMGSMPSGLSALQDTMSRAAFLRQAGLSMPLHQILAAQNHGGPSLDMYQGADLAARRQLMLGGIFLPHSDPLRGLTDASPTEFNVDVRIAEPGAYTERGDSDYSDLEGPEQVQSSLARSQKRKL